MTTVKDLYLGVIRDSITRHPRSQQKRIGPSEIGKPCDRWILHKLHGDGEPDRGPAWKPAVGTAVHDQLERWFDEANRGGGELDKTEWITEWQVTVGTIGGTSITGHSDLFHVPTGTVIDHKVVGPKMLTKYRIHGPSEQYRVQAHLYGKGFTDDGGWGPCRTVAIAFLPRDGELQNAVFWSEPYNPHLAGEAMLRANRLNLLLQVVGIDAALQSSPLCDDEWCTWCKTERRAQHRAAGGSLFDVPPAGPKPAPGNAIPPLAQLIPTPATPAASPIPLRPVAPTALCAVCGTVLHPLLVTEGSTTHPTCQFPTPNPIPATPQPAALAPITNLFDR